MNASSPLPSIVGSMYSSPEVLAENTPAREIENDDGLITASDGSIYTMTSEDEDSDFELPTGNAGNFFKK